ncbi:MAG: hypothetical protein M3326_04530 [Actinomycetota bacterium]|nr:hypothetical protein [Actinomycetota bacterium]
MDADSGGRAFGLRIGSVVAAMALVLAMVVLIQHRADAAPAAGGAAVASVAGVHSEAAQINIAQIVCPILLAVRNAFASTPFFSFVQPILDQLLVAFGCTISGAG